MQRTGDPPIINRPIGTIGGTHTGGGRGPPNDLAPSVGSVPSEVSDEVRQTVTRSVHNQAEILVAPDEYVERLDQRFINELETVSVTPEAPWDEPGEKLLRNWMAEAQAASASHQTTGYKLKRRYKTLQFASIVSAAIVFIVTTLFPCTTEDSYRYIQVTASGIATAITSFTGFLNYGVRYREHFEYEGHYACFATDIEELLVTDRDFRAPKDKSITEFRERKKHLTKAPEL